MVCLSYLHLMGHPCRIGMSWVMLAEQDCELSAQNVIGMFAYM